MQKQIDPNSTLLEGSNRMFILAEIFLVLLVPIVLIPIMRPWVDGNPVKNTIVIWLAYAIMLAMIWTSIKLRGQSWSHFGLTFKAVSIRGGVKIFGWSLLVFIFGTAAFVIGSVLMANIVGIPESADFSKYDYLKDNIGMLFLTLAGVYVVSSFGEEVIFRAFLITRISEFGQKSKKAIIAAVILSSLIFGLAHYEWGLMGIVQTGFMGLAMGISYILFKRKLWILIWAHVYMDTLLIVQMYLASN